jgi:HEAT repeat protein/ATP/ADP translocase
VEFENDGYDMLNRIPSILTSRHNLLQTGEQSTFFLQRILRVYPEEVKLLLWVTAIQLVMSASSILLNNFAQTAFLKRYGVESLPTIFLIEAILTFGFANAVGFLMNRMSTIRVFTGLFLFFAVSIGLIRGLLPLGNPMVYPVLYILKSQAVEILPILYWDILSDLFTTQQSKRLYTLITAGGVLGTTLGSLLTGKVAHWIGADNVLLIFVTGMVLAAILNELTERVAGAPLEPRTDRDKGRLQGPLRKNLSDFINFARTSPLLKYMMLIIAIPNILLPILTYQFNVVVDAYFTTEQATLQFFGIFRGVSNAVMFIILLFSGRLITHWGVAPSLLLHPINYLIAFGGLLFHFDILSGMYARFSTEILKTTLNNPARAILYNFFPEQMRGLVRVFLRGTVIRAADFAGSGFLMLIKGIMDPRLLSLVAAPLSLIWIITSIKIKKKYSALLMQTLMEDYIDWKSLEDLDFKVWLKNKQVVKRLRQGLEGPDPEIALVSAEIIAKAVPAGWAKWIVRALPGRPAETQKGLLDLLTIEDGKDAVEELLRIAPTAPPNTLAYLIQTLNRLDAGSSLAITERFLDHPDPRVRVEALAGLYLSHSLQAQTDFRQRIRDMLDAGEAEARSAIKVLGQVGDPFFSEMLLESAKGEDPDLKAWALCGLGKMGHEEAMEIALSAIGDLSIQVREAALQVLKAVKGKTSLAVWIHLLGNQDPRFRKEASMVIQERGEETVQDLLPVLASPSRVAKNEALSILTKLGPPRTDISQFIMKELEKPYRDAAYVRVLQKSETGRAFPLLLDHILELNNEAIEVVLRVLGVMEFGDKIEIILKALQSSNRKDKENAIEALENSLHSKIRRVLIPLFEENPSEKQMAMVGKTLGIMALPDSTGVILLQLLKDDDPIIQALTVYALGEGVIKQPPINAIAELLDSKIQIVREAAQCALRVLEGKAPTEHRPPRDLNLIEKAISVRKIPIFNDLRVQEIMVIASKSLMREFAKGEVVLREGDAGDAFFLIIEGEMAVIKGMGKEQEFVLDRIGKDDFFGEIALLDGSPHSASIRAESEALVLVINDEDFVRIMDDYLSVPLKICGVLVRRIRELHDRLRITS